MPRPQAGNACAGILRPASRPYALAAQTGASPRRNSMYRVAERSST